MFELIEPIMNTIIQWLPAVIIVTIVAIFVIRFGAASTTRRWVMLRERMTKQQYRAKASLLSLETLVEKYAPASRYEKDTDENRGGKQWAFISSYPRAVKASNKRYGRISKGKLFASRRQIADAAKRITVTAIPDEAAVAGDTNEHYRIDLKLDGHDPADFKRMRGQIAGQLGLHSIENFDTSDNFAVSFIAHMTEPVDVLTEHKAGIEFFEEHKASNTYSIPLALKKNRHAWNLPTHHTIILGMTGSGKGSPLNGLIRQLAPYVERGTAKLYGIDPKASELRPYEESSLFEEIVYENDEAIQVIAHVHKLMKVRTRSKKVDVVNGDLGRSLDASKENPLIILMIDELLSLLIALQGMGREGKASLTTLTEILAQGRSLGVIVMGATQEADRDLFGRMRGNFANTIVLRQPSPYFNDLFLGEGAKERGFDSTAIPLSTRANGYAYAGIGYVKEETGEPVKVRFAYSSDEDISALIRDYPREQHDDYTDDDGGFNFDED